ncbi:hypothetical protein GCM10007972_27740 [Iodidimonas muriae]|uniref:HTH cro/C1-type domain-containing protein n=1 Tax=Iodidimonas muriae TaxID=261467 RepID=A0ABQ2LGK7_9PROT|nr:helix-turn-helix domain-containing protein [Iodidimonas muriae]GER08815.1 hypothetical protein JCM17843_31250 [Kordiimonadales bacterium JCM 17843]GGO17552.1 hypothetical protein GCM10007972_27740 [Iodidimonas muriae]
MKTQIDLEEFTMGLGEFLRRKRESIRPGYGSAFSCRYKDRLSIRDVSTELGIPRARLVLIEKGEKSPTIKELLALCHKYKLDKDQIISIIGREISQALVD